MDAAAGLPHFGVESPLLAGLRPTELQTVLSAATRNRALLLTRFTGTLQRILVP